MNRSILCTAVCCLALSAPVLAENIIFPPNTPGVHDLTKAPYYADKTGQNDVTAILNRALDENRCQGNWAPQIVYLPNGTYLVSAEVTWKLPPYTVGPHLQGQSQAGTVIKLKDSTWVSPTQIGYVVKTGGDVAQNFDRGLFNVTINTGRGNPGAIGLKWYANNEALMSDVSIIDEDGRAAAGMQVGTIEQGPCMARRVYIRGFRFGVLARPSLNTTTLSEIFLEGQTQYGIYHTGGLPLYIDSLYSRNTVPAVYNGSDAQMVLINADLGGGDPSKPAVINEVGGMLFARNITSRGYAKAIESTSGPTPSPAGNTVVEFLSHQGVSLFGSPLRSLNLPMKRPPEPPWEQDMSKWANVEDYRAGRTDEQAIQAAIDDPTKTTVLIPMGQEYSVNQDVYVRGTIRMVIATGGGFGAGRGSIVFSDSPGGPPVVKLMKLMASTESSPTVVHRSSRTLILETISLNQDRGGFGVVHEGTGDLFGTDIVNPLKVTNPQAHAWIWHYDAERNTYQLEVSAGNVWIFGWKDEGSGSSALLTGGVTEILGFFNYGGDTEDVPQFVIDNAAVSIAAGRKGRYGEGWDLIVRETQAGVTRELRSTDNPTGYPTQFDIPLFTSYDATPAHNHLPGLRDRSTPSPEIRVVSGGKLRVTHAGAANVRILDALGRAAWRQSLSTPHAGGNPSLIEPAPLPRGVHFVDIVSEGRRHSQAVSIVE